MRKALPASGNSDVAKLLQKAISEHQADRFSAARKLYEIAIKKQKDNIVALHLLGILEAQQKNTGKALQLFDRALSINPNAADVLADKGKVLTELARHDDALQCYQRAISINPGHWQALHNQACTLLTLKRSAEALAAFDRVLEITGPFPPAFNNRGVALADLHRYVEAIASFRQATALNPRDVEAWSNLGDSLCKIGNYKDALPAYDKALSVDPDFAEAWLGRGNVFLGLKRYDDARSAYDRALALKPGLAEASFGRGWALNSLKRHVESAQAFLDALNIDAAFPFVKGFVLFQKMLTCDWRDIDRLTEEIHGDIARERLSGEPFAWQAIATSPESLQACARLYSQRHFPSQNAGTIRITDHDDRKIRIGYLSGEFRDQATSHLLVGVLEAHDAERFEIFAFDNGGDDQSEVRNRIVGAVDHLIKIRELSDIEAHDLIQRHRIDILVNLNGFFGDGRMRVFSRRPAPIQVNYLGFPGTLGATYMDYIIADDTTLPAEHRAWYDEKVCYLPDCYQANDALKKIGSAALTRADCRLPEDGFVYCCFNNSYKISSDRFASFMRILNSVPGSVLWLLEDNASAAANLRAEARARGVAPERLVFAPRMSLADHLARHRLADLFLDTLPYNAHTTASDALWTGLPVLTQIGDTFPGRVAASLLNAIGLPELVTRSRDEYEDYAVELASDPAKLATIKDKLARNRLTTPLFDTRSFTRHLERAYAAMYERCLAGLPPDHIFVSKA